MDRVRALRDSDDVTRAFDRWTSRLVRVRAAPWLDRAEFDSCPATFDPRAW